MNDVDKSTYSVDETIRRIVNLTEGLSNFWKNSDGWAPVEATELLTKSRLDWQSSLSRQLRLFSDPTNTESGLLILAWTTLGSLVEGSLKLFLSVFYKDYQTETLKREIKNIFDKNGNLIDPDNLVLEKLRIFFEKRVFPKDAKNQWKKNGEPDWLDWILKIQNRRNAIHSFKDRKIGTLNEFHEDLKVYLIFIRKINNTLPYPDIDYKPTEI